MQHPPYNVLFAFQRQRFVYFTFEWNGPLEEKRVQAAMVKFHSNTELPKFRKTKRIKLLTLHILYLAIRQSRGNQTTAALWNASVVFFISGLKGEISNRPKIYFILFCISDKNTKKKISQLGPEWKRPPLFSKQHWYEAGKRYWEGNQKDQYL